MLGPRLPVEDLQGRAYLRAAHSNFAGGGAHGGYSMSTPVIACTANVAAARRQLAGLEGVHAVVASAPMRERPSREIRMPG